MALFSNGQGKKIVGRSLVAYRLQNQKSIDAKTAADVSFKSKPQILTT